MYHMTSDNAYDELQTLKAMQSSTSLKTECGTSDLKGYAELNFIENRMWHPAACRSLLQLVATLKGSGQGGAEL